MNQQQLKSLRTRSAAKLTEDQVIEIRDLLVEGKLTYRQIAEMFRVTEPTIYNINKGKTWDHIEGLGAKIRARTSCGKLDEAQVLKIRDLLLEGILTYKQIAEMFGISVANIRVINAGKTWTHVEGMGSRIRVIKNKGEGLDESQVMKIRDLLIEGKLTMEEIGMMFGVSSYVVRLIDHGKIWVHVEGIGSKLKETKRSNRAKLNTDQAEEIRDLLIGGDLTNKEIGERFGVSRQTISYINEGKIWTNVERIGSKIRTKK